MRTQDPHAVISRGLWRPDCPFSPADTRTPPAWRRSSGITWRLPVRRGRQEGSRATSREGPAAPTRRGPSPCFRAAAPPPPSFKSPPRGGPAATARARAAATTTRSSRAASGGWRPLGLRAYFASPSFLVPRYLSGPRSEAEEDLLVAAGHQLHRRGRPAAPRRRLSARPRRCLPGGGGALRGGGGRRSAAESGALRGSPAQGSSPGSPAQGSSRGGSAGRAAPDGGADGERR